MFVLVVLLRVDVLTLVGVLVAKMTQRYVFVGADHDRRGLEVSLNQGGACMQMQIKVAHMQISVRSLVKFYI